MLHRVSDQECDHSYVVVHAIDEISSSPAEPTTRKIRPSEFPKNINMWPLDSHQLYGMPCRYDFSLYNHDHSKILDSKAKKKPTLFSAMTELNR